MVSIRGVQFGPLDGALRELFLRSAPRGEAIRAFVAESASARGAPSFRAFYDLPSYTATYVTAASGRVVCLMALQVTATQAAGIESRMGYTGAAAWTSLPFFQDSVEAAIGDSINPGCPRGTYLA